MLQWEALCRNVQSLLAKRGPFGAARLHCEATSILWYPKHLSRSVPSTKSSRGMIRWPLKCMPVEGKDVLHLNAEGDTGFIVTCFRCFVTPVYIGGAGIDAPPNFSSVCACRMTTILAVSHDWLMGHNASLRSSFMWWCSVVSGLGYHPLWLLVATKFDRTINVAQSCYSSFLLGSQFFCSAWFIFCCPDDLN